jgi:hypothetical protein
LVEELPVVEFGWREQERTIFTAAAGRPLRERIQLFVANVAPVAG